MFVKEFCVSSIIHCWHVIASSILIKVNFCLSEKILSIERKFQLKEQRLLLDYLEKWGMNIKAVSRSLKSITLISLQQWWEHGQGSCTLTDMFRIPLGEATPYKLYEVTRISSGIACSVPVRIKDFIWVDVKVWLNGNNTRSRSSEASLIQLALKCGICMYMSIAYSNCWRPDPT